MTNRISTLLVFITVSISSLLGNDVKVLNFVTLDWQPYVGENLKNEGFTTKILREALKLEGYEIKTHYMPWARALKEAESGKFDAIYPAYFSEERSKAYNTSKSFCAGPLVFFQRDGLDLTYESFEDLKQYKIGVVRGYINTRVFDEATYLNKKVSNSDLQNMLKLAKGRVDLVVIDQFLGLHLINESDDPAMKQLTFIKKPLENKTLHLLVSKNIQNSEKLLDAFHKGLDELERKGEVEKIISTSMNDQ